MSEEKKIALIDGDLMRKKKSRLREEVEQALQKKGISVERRISVINLETKEAHYFDDYVQAMQFLKGKKGRWYLATPGIRRQ
jgi:DNA-binding LacI/PurR family transcriptional regulator